MCNLMMQSYCVISKSTVSYLLTSKWLALLITFSKTPTFFYIKICSGTKVLFYVGCNVKIHKIPDSALWTFHGKKSTFVSKKIVQSLCKIFPTQVLSPFKFKLWRPSGCEWLFCSKKSRLTVWLGVKRRTELSWTPAIQAVSECRIF